MGGEIVGRREGEIEQTGLGRRSKDETTNAVKCKINIITKVVDIKILLYI